ncbi:MAG TPA: ABC transporter ATP-binding protein [Candidatus Deferrimicrobium sp.]|nr:ABC transporter ATP-binding protein [Candidatus Deferrimicrobium sp.]
MIKIINCKKIYDDTVLFKNINLTAHTGECIVLIGANGSGKTTMLKALLGIIAVDEGKIVFAENVRVGFLLDDQLLFDEFSIENNMKIYCPLSGIKSSKRKESIRRWLDYFGLYEQRKKKVKKISAGMRKRLALAIANLKDPDILLLDEPLNGLDSESQVKFTNLIQNKIRAGALVIIVSHIIELLKPLATRWIILKDGELTEQYSPPGDQFAADEHANDSLETGTML